MTEICTCTDVYWQRRAETGGSCAANKVELQLQKAAPLDALAAKMLGRTSWKPELQGHCYHVAFSFKLHAGASCFHAARLGARLSKYAHCRSARLVFAAPGLLAEHIRHHLHSLELADSHTSFDLDSVRQPAAKIRL